jgi:LysR family transcriptional activator of nhaA
MGKSTQLKGSQINWNQVFYFAEVATHGSLKDASQKLGLSPSTLSEHISQLEKDLEVELFHRLHRKLTLTPEGTKLYLHARQMFETGQRLIDVVSPISLGCYPVSVGLVPSLSLSIAYGILNAYIAENRDLNMKFLHSKHEELEKGLSEAKFDFGFSNQAPERKDIVAHLVSITSLSFYVRTDLAERRFSELLADMPILICKSELGIRSPIEDVLEEIDLAPRAIISSDYPSLILELCQNGKGIGIFGEDTIESQHGNGLKVLRNPRGAPKLKEKLFALWPKGGENSESVRQLKTIL